MTSTKPSDVEGNEMSLLGLTLEDDRSNHTYTDVRL